MRKQVLCAVVITSALFAGAGIHAVAPQKFSSEQIGPDFSMKIDLDKKKRDLEKKQKKLNLSAPTPAPIIIGLKTYLSAVANLELSQQVVKNEEGIIFNTLYIQNGDLAKDEATKVITANQSGIYEVTFGASWTSADPQSFIALSVNGDVVDASRVTSSKTMSIIIDASKNDSTTFEVVNDSSSNITLVGDAAGKASSAFITIKKIN